MAAVEKILITGVNVEKASAENQYDITLTWDVSVGEPYTGNYYLILYYSEEYEPPLLMESGGQEMREFTLRGVTLNPGRQYAVALSAKLSGFTRCEKVPVTFRAFEGLGVHYENDVVTIGWNPPHESIRGGVLTLEFPAGDFYAYGVTEGTHVYTFAIPEEWLDSHCYRMPLPASWFTQASCSVSITSLAADISSGPESGKVTLPLQTLTISSVKLGDFSGSSRTLTVNLSGGSGGYIQLGFFKDGRLLCMSDPIACAASIQYALKEQLACNAQDYEVMAFLSSADAKTYNRRITDGNRMPLSCPALSADFTSGKLAISWEHDAPGCTAYSIKLGASGEKTVYGHSYTFADNPDTFMDADCVLTPKYGAKTGVAAVVRPFREGFYYSGGCLAYKSGSYAEQGFGFTLPGSAFPAAVSSPVEKEPFKLTADGLGYKVTVAAGQPPRETFLEWLGMLFEKGLTPAGYYKLRDAISRLICVGEVERLWYASGIDPAAPLRADVFPGMTMRVQTAHYKPQDLPVADYMAGYTPGSLCDYTVSLSGGALSVSPYLLKAMGYFSYSTEPHNPPFFHVSGGALDFFSVDLKQPYWTLRYPSSYPRSDSASNLYTGNNPTLFAVPTWADAKDADSDVHTHLVFRGRSTVSLLFTVFVNGAPRLVPAGSAIEDLLSELGCAGQGLRLCRNTGLGALKEAYWVKGEMLLLSGDRIEV